MVQAIGGWGLVKKRGSDGKNGGSTKARNSPGSQ